MQKNVSALVSLMVPLAILVAGCGGDDTHEEPPASADAEGCEHMIGGPSAPVTASAAADTAAPAVAADHRRYDVALMGDTMGGNAGFVSFAPSEAVDWVFYLSADVPFVIQDGSGADVAIEDKQTSVADCTEVKARHQVELAVGTYYLRFGPTADASVSVVVEEAGGHEH